MRSICFVAPAAWPVLSRDRTIQSVGGAEVQQCTIARSLAERGWQVSMVCLDYGQPRVVEVDGVVVRRAYNPSRGIRGVRFVYPRLTSLWTAMDASGADLYYHRCASVLTAQVAAFCKHSKRKFIYAAANDSEFLPRPTVLTRSVDRAMFRWGLRSADSIVVQNSAQQTLCKSVHGVAPQLIRSCYAPPPTARSSRDGYILWVSTIRPGKHAHRVLELARRLPQYRFRVVGGPAPGRDSSVYADVRNEARSIPNVEFVGFVPYADIESEFDGARVLLNTSDSEGFPNTFLQSWARRIPTVSFIDPGAPCVVLASHLEHMTALLDEHMTDDEVWRSAGEHSYRWYERNHSPEAVVSAYEQLLCSLLMRPST